MPAGWKFRVKLVFRIQLAEQIVVARPVAVWNPRKQVVEFFVYAVCALAAPQVCFNSIDTPNSWRSSLMLSSVQPAPAITTIMTSLSPFSCAKVEREVFWVHPLDGFIGE